MQNNPLDVRLQDLIVGWRGEQRGEPLGALHQLCVDIAKHDNPYLLPKRVYVVKDLDSATLREALKHSSVEVRFQADPQGRFDAALVPARNADGVFDRFVLAVEQALPLSDQVALYAHAVGHLLLNNQARLLSGRLNLNPDNGMTHYDRLASLRYIEKIRSKADRDVLESFPKLSTLIEPPQESIATIASATRDVVTRLRGRGWKSLETPYEFTAGRILPGSTQRGRRRTIDVLLRASSSLPIAVLHVQRAGETYLDAVQRVQDAAERLALPFAYLVEPHGTVHEFDYQQGGEPVHMLCDELPAHGELLRRWLDFLQLSKDEEILTYPYYQGKRPRYYQDAAINRALIAVLQARRGLREKRVLLTLATGTGKTLIAFQLLWKLKQKRAVRNVLFLADRSYLLGQAIIGDFAPLRERIWLGEGESRTAHDMLFASYQWLTKVQNGTSHYHDYPVDYFDVIIVDECHRGSASEDSLWRSVLTYFSGAVQVGLTATPLDTKEVQTRDYFGSPVYMYELSKGINDGFLAPYRVRRVLLGQEEIEAEEAAEEEGSLDPLRGTAATSTLAEALVMETREKMRQYTQVIAEHLANYLQQSDPRAKTIVFCVDNEHAAQMRDALQTAAASWARPGDIVRIVDDDKQDGKLALDTFCSTEEKQPVVVTTSKLLSTGIDAPTCKNIVLARAVGSIVEFKQIIGRGTRLFGREKTWFTILDYAGAIKHFFDPKFDGNPEFIINEPLAPRPSSPAAPDEPGQQPVTTIGESETPAEAGATAQASASSAFNSPAVSAQTEETPGAQPAETETTDTPTTPFAGEDSFADEDEATVSQEASTPAFAYDIGAQSANEPGYAAEQPASPPAREHLEVKEPRPVGEHQYTGSSSEPAQGSAHTPAPNAPPASPRGSAARSQPATPPPVREVARRADGTRIVVQGELWFELGADGRRLRDQSQTLQDWAKLTLRNLVQTPQELSARWLDPLQREELINVLKDQVVALDVLAREMRLEDRDPFDVLVQAVFGTPALTRSERVALLRQQHAAFFQRAAQNPLASQVIDAILRWYTQVSIPWEKPETLDIVDTELLKVQPIAALGSYPQLVLALKGKQSSAKGVLQELQRLLYSV